jgi:type II secretory ATPase GspE/PulE/Tfp pilus assembly ATPase PilB-like protein
MNASNNQPIAEQGVEDVLLEAGLLSSDQLRIAQLEQKRTGLGFIKVVVQLGFVSEGALRDVLSENYGHQSADLHHVVADAQALSIITRDFAKRYLLFPIAYQIDVQTLVLATSDMDNVVALDQARLALTKVMGGDAKLELRLASESDILEAIEQYYGHTLSIDGILQEIEHGDNERTGVAVGDTYSHPIVRLVDAILADAIRKQASDIHLEPEHTFLRIRYRIDGVMRQVRVLHATYWPAMVVRIKVLASMNIAEVRAPQDGRFSITLNGRPIDFRVASQPTQYGENVVLRILDQVKGLVALDQLGLTESKLKDLQLMLARPEGMILVTGPTGSGKTTTLYSILKHINHEGVNIMTLEDPIEYPLPMVRQSSISEASKLDFANGIRSLMRQDPDVILIGEIRDHETAEMALRAAMTGHQVFSTLHTNSAVGSIARLLDIGVLPDVLSGNLIGVVAQRLVRVLCEHCKEPHTASAIECTLLGVAVTQDSTQLPTLYQPVGCEHCDFQGHKGRRALMEILRFDADMDDMVVRKASQRELTDLAKHKGFETLADDGIRVVLQGKTTLDELSRVVDLTSRVSNMSATGAR